ncbi:hypothetical protein [Halosimplex rubrum]|nr:hypothetical protein [Halosimplex rubrum]
MSSVASLPASTTRRKTWLPDQAENRLHAQKGLLAWLAEQE